MPFCLASVLPVFKNNFAMLHCRFVLNDVADGANYHCNTVLTSIFFGGGRAVKFYHAYASTEVLTMINLHTKCEMSSFITGTQYLQMGHVIPTTPSWGTVIHQKANTYHVQLVYRI